MRKLGIVPSVLIVLVVIVALWTVLVVVSEKAMQDPPGSPPRLTDEERREERFHQIFSSAEAANIVTRAQLTGVLTKFDVNPDYTQAHVGRPFSELTLEQKELLAIALHLYSQEHGGTPEIAFRDAYTGKKVAVFQNGHFSLR